MRELVTTWWPVIILVLGVGASTVRAEGQNASQEARIDYIYQRGSPAVVERLARIEANQDTQRAQLDRIEHKLDERR